MKTTLFAALCAALVTLVVSAAHAGDVTVKIEGGGVSMSCADRNFTLTAPTVTAKTVGTKDGVGTVMTEVVRGVSVSQMNGSQHVQEAFHHVFAPPPQPIIRIISPPPQPVYVPVPQPAYIPGPPPEPECAPAPAPAPPQPQPANCCSHCGRTGPQLVWVEGRRFICRDHTTGPVSFVGCDGNTWLYDRCRHLWYDP